MIIDDLKNQSKYEKAYPFLKDAFLFLKSNQSAIFGKHKINANVFANVEECLPKPKEQQKLEIHKKYIDIQYIIDGCDVIGWKNTNDCKEIFKDYDIDKDIAFFNDKPDFMVRLNPKKFVILFPQDAHMPLCCNGKVIKCIVKIKVENC